VSLESGSARAWVAAAVAVLALLFGVAWLLVAPESRKPLDDYVASVRAAGKPVTAEEAVGPPPPRETNGCVDLDSACKWLDEHAGPPSKWTYAGPWNQPGSPTWYDDEPPERLAALDKFLASLQPYFDGFAASFAKPRLVPTTTRNVEGWLVESGVARLLEAIPVIQARALAASRAEDRLDAVALLLALSVRVDSPSALSQILRSAASRAGVLALRRDLERDALDVKAARTRLDPLLAERSLPRVPAMVAYLRAQMLDVATHVDVGGLARSRPLSRAFEQAVDRIERSLTGKPPLSDPDYVGTPKQFAEAHAAFAPLESLPTDSYPRMAAEIRTFVSATTMTPFVERWMPASPTFIEHIARMDAATSLARIALAVAEHRAKHGDFPASLDEVKPMFPDGVPLDPYNDAPFVYERTSAGARIASAGRLPEDKPLDAAKLRERCLVWELKR
jgi:hypothetical protein